MYLCPLGINGMMIVAAVLAVLSIFLSSANLVLRGFKLSIKICFWLKLCMWHFSMEINLCQTRFKIGSVMFKLHMCGEKKAASAIPAPLTALCTGTSFLHMTGFFLQRKERQIFSSNSIMLILRNSAEVPCVV